jgi:hypothetical protein
MDQNKNIEKLLVEKLSEELRDYISETAGNSLG